MRYGLAIIFVAGMFAFRLALTPILSYTYPLVYFTLAIVAAARFGGRGPGLVATALSVAGADYFFAAPRYSLALADPAEILGLLMLAATGVGISWLVPPEREKAKTRAAVHPRVFTAARLRRVIVLGSAVVVNLLLSWVLYSDFEREKDAERLVNHTYQVLAGAGAIESALEQAESAERGYVITHGVEFQAAIESALRELDSDTHTLQKLTTDNPTQQTRLKELDRLVEERVTTLQKVVAARQSLGFDAAKEMIRTGEGIRRMGKCRALLQTVENAERELLRARSNAVDAEALRTHWVLGLGSGSLVLLLVIAGVVIEGDVQRRERHRLDLQQSDQRLRLALEAAGAGTWEWDAETNQSIWSEELWKLFGLDRHASEPSAAEWRGAVHPEDRERAETAFRHAAAIAGDLSLEFRIGSRDGRERWLLTRARQLPVPTGEPARLMGIALEITERKQVEEALKERERTLRRFTEIAPAAIAMFDRNMRYLAVSDRFRKDFALTDQELVGLSHYEVFPEIPEHWREIHQRCLAGAVERHPGERFVRADGSEQWTRWEIHPWQQTGGEIGGIVLFTEDITQQVRSEQALRESEERFRALVTASSDVVYRISSDWSEMYHVQGRDFVADTESPNRDWLQVYIPSNDRPQVTAVINEAIRTKSIFELEHRVLRADGSVGWTFSRAIPRLNAQGEITEWFGAASDITRRKEAEQALQASLERLKKVLEIETVGVMFWDLNTGCMVDANDTFLKLMGYSRSDVEARELRWQNLTPPEYMDVSRAEVEKFLATGRVGPYEKEYFRKDGTRQWLLFAGSSLGNNQCVEFCVDISARKQTELALRESRAKLEAALASMTDAVFISDAAGRFVQFNEAFATFLRFPSTEECYKTLTEYPAVFDLFFPDGTPAALDMWPVARALRGESATNAEYTLRRNDTGESWTGSHGFAPIRDAQGAIVGSVVVARDITDRKRAEAALAESESRYRGLFESMQEAFLLGEVIFDEAGKPCDWRYLDVNPYFEGIYGRKREEVVGKTYREVLPGAYSDHWVGIAGRVTLTGNGEKFASQSNTGLFLEGTVYRPRPGQFAAIIADATARREAEEQIRRLNAELEQRVRERTAELQAANKELESFCYSVSHDLRAPLRGIDGWSLALVEDYGRQLDPKAQTYLDRVRSEAQRMGLLIDDLLQLSRVTRAAMNRKAVNLAAIASTVAARLCEQYARRRIHFIIDPDLVAAGDAGLLEIALTNLLGNSAKFTGREAEARIEFGQTRNGGERAFYVRDNGVGFDMAYADTLFGAFQRLHQPADFPGTGIGLVTVQRIIHRHGGRIWAEAQVGQGATFYFTLGDSSCP